jgi:F-type H+-transporting ATPase subunit epsilon
MAATFTFELVTPERVLMSQPVEQVSIPGADGDFTVFAGHAPVVSTLRPGVIEAKGADGKITRIYVRGGFCEVAPDSLTVLAETARDADAMTGEAGLAELKGAEADLAAATTDDDRWAANIAIERLKALSGKAA